jgi:DNA-binding MarR family transcriptional regulator
MSRINHAISQWRKEMPALDTLTMSTVANLGEANRLIASQYLTPFFRSFNLQAGEFDVLATLRRSGSPFSLAPTHLFKALMVSSGGMTNRLDRLENAGLIARKPNPDDRRGTLVSLTEKGTALINTMMPLHVDNEMKALDGLSREEQKTLNHLLDKLVAGLADE